MEDNNWKAMRISSVASRNFIQSVVWNAPYLQVVLIPSQIVLTKVCNQFHYTRFSITLESSSCLHFESLCLSREIRTEHTNFEGSSPFAIRIKKFSRENLNSNRVKTEVYLSFAEGLETRKYFDFHG